MPNRLPQTGDTYLGFESHEKMKGIKVQTGNTQHVANAPPELQDQHMTVEAGAVQLSRPTWPTPEFMTQAILNSAIVVVTDVAGTIIQCNDRFCQISGYLREEVLGLNHRALISDVHDEAFFYEESRVLARGKIWRGTVCCTRKGGSPYWADTTTVPQMAADGQPVAYVSIQFDISAYEPSKTGWKAANTDDVELELFEAALKDARTNVESANAARSTFLANVSHEIRTPMNGIIGITALLLQTELSPQQKRLAEVVRVSADALNNVIDNILDISKLEAGTLELEEVEFNLEELLKAIIERFTSSAAEKCLQIGYRLDQSALRPLKGDARRLRQIILNLVSNAVKFTDRGSVAISVQSQTLALDRIKLRIEVQDTGIGFGDDTKSQLFHKFQQADNSATRNSSGAGLGLSICCHLVELMGGTIGAEHRAEGGSTFWIELTFYAPTAEQKPALPIVREIEQIRALVVDDAELTRRIFVRQLEALGAIAQATAASSCMWVLSRAEEAGLPYDIMLLDDATSELSGPAVAAQIRSNPTLHQPKIILLSSPDSLVCGDVPLETLVDAVLKKPIHHKALVRCLAALMADTHSPNAETENIAQPPQKSVSLGRILLVDDNEVNQLLAKLVLERAGYGVTCVADGATAVTAASQSPYDLILMDVQMPVLDGLQATRLIRKLGGEMGSVPIVALTASTLIEDRKSCVAAGMNDYHPKPIVPNEFLDLVARRIRRRPCASRHQRELSVFERCEVGRSSR